MEHLGNTKLTKTSVYKGLILDYGIIWNSMKYECGGGGGNRNRTTKIPARLLNYRLLFVFKNPNGLVLSYYAHTVLN